MFRESTDFHMPIFVFCRFIKFLNKIYDLIVEPCRYFDVFFSDFSPGFFSGLLVFHKYVFQCCVLANYLQFLLPVIPSFSPLRTGTIQTDTSVFLYLFQLPWIFKITLLGEVPQATEKSVFCIYIIFCRWMLLPFELQCS